jgi:hypothetical protein
MEEYNEKLRCPACGDISRALLVVRTTGEVSCECGDHEWEEHPLADLIQQQRDVLSGGSE